MLPAWGFAGDLRYGQMAGRSGHLHSGVLLLREASFLQCCCETPVEFSWQTRNLFEFFAKKAAAHLSIYYLFLVRADYPQIYA